MNDPCAGDYGTVYTFTITENGAIVDISGATVKDLIIVRPDGSSINLALTFVTNGTDGQVKYTTVNGDIPANLPGRYVFQIVIQSSSGKWYTTTFSQTMRQKIAQGAP